MAGAHWIQDDFDIKAEVFSLFGSIKLKGLSCELLWSRNLKKTKHDTHHTTQHTYTRTHIAVAQSSGSQYRGSESLWRSRPRKAIARCEHLMQKNHSTSSPIIQRRDEQYCQI